MPKKYVLPAEINHKKYGSKWKFPKAKKFFKTILGTDKFVEEIPGGAGDSIFRFKNEYIWLEAYVAYGSDRIQLNSINPHETIGFYKFETFEKDGDYMYKERDRSWEADKKQIQYEFRDWLHSLANGEEKHKKLFDEEIRKIKAGEY